ncbi:hypothetical protein F5884DRAFT_101238 [Xylogone sp. PMI_703]|nr:hypothetical protein F5884DRAFT_101238 [Xylogone sp. PMI_703]
MRGGVLVSGGGWMDGILKECELLGSSIAGVSGIYMKVEQRGERFLEQKAVVWESLMEMMYLPENKFVSFQEARQRIGGVRSAAVAIVALRLRAACLGFARSGPGALSGVSGGIVWALLSSDTRNATTAPTLASVRMMTQPTSPIERCRIRSCKNDVLLGPAYVIDPVNLSSLQYLYSIMPSLVLAASSVRGSGTGSGWLRWLSAYPPHVRSRQS